MKALLNPLFAALCSPTILKMVSFAMIGVANVLVDFAVFAFAYKLLEMPLVPSNVIAWSSIRFLRDQHIDHLRHKSGRILRREDYLILRFQNLERGDHDARRPFIFC